MRTLALLPFLGFLRAAALSLGDKAPVLEAKDSYGRPVDFRGATWSSGSTPRPKAPGAPPRPSATRSFTLSSRNLGPGSTG